MQADISRLGLSHRPVCIHASLRSFGHVAGGANSVVQAFLHEHCTLLVPSHSWNFAVTPSPDQWLPCNGWNYDVYAGPNAGNQKIFTSATTDIDKDMGAIAAAVVAHPAYVRGNHPLCSFSAVGPLALVLVKDQHPTDMYAPLEALAEMGGFVVLMGVDLRSLTLLHAAEKAAGRTMFHRWANDTQGCPMAVEVGGCSEGFNVFEPLLRPAMGTTIVGTSVWRVIAAQPALAIATAVIRAQPSITHCGVAACERCHDAVAGGPLF
jgi:aminoglycoside 3-N-acetyltransferase